LQLALVALRALRENIEDQTGPVQHPNVQALFQIALLRRRQRVVEDDDFDAVGQHGLADFVRLAAADEISRVRSGALCRDHRHRFRPG